jgi:hypothetical protein
MTENNDSWSEVTARFEALARKLEVHADAVSDAVSDIADVVEGAAISVLEVCRDCAVRDDAAEAIAAIGRALRSSIASSPPAARTRLPFAHPSVEEELAHPGG